MTCGGGATYSAYQPWRAFTMAAAASAVGADLSNANNVSSYGNPPLPESYPSTGQNPYGPQFPPPPGPAGTVDSYGPIDLDTTGAFGLQNPGIFPSAGASASSAGGARQPRRRRPTMVRTVLIVTIIVAVAVLITVLVCKRKKSK